MRVLHCVNESRLAWARPFVQLLLALRERGADCTVLCAPGGTLSGFLEKAEIPCITDKPPFPWFPAACRNVGKVMEEVRPDLIVTRLSSASLLGGHWGRRLGIPVVGVLDKFSKRKYYSSAGCVQAVSSALLAHALSWGTPPAVLIPNCIATAEYAPDPQVRARFRASRGIGAGEGVVLGAGRFVEWKGFSVLLGAFRDLMERLGNGSPFHLVLAGDGEERNRFERLARDWKMEERVHFTGFVEDIRPLLWSSDLFVLPSREPEPFGLVLLEAMASGLPVIATDCGGPLDMVDPGRNGWLVPPGDQAALSGVLESSLLGGDLSTVGKAAMAASARFDTSSVADATLELYRNMTERGTPR